MYGYSSLSYKTGELAKFIWLVLTHSYGTVLKHLSFLEQLKCVQL
jgi:hypothetical protein